MDAHALLSQLLLPDNLKEQFGHAQNISISPRRLAYATTLLNLCEVLHSQCQFTSTQIAVLKAYLPAATGHLLDQLLAQWATDSIADGKTNVYSTMRQLPYNACITSTPAQLREEPPVRQLPPPTRDRQLVDAQRHAVYRLIVDEMGKKWREFGRELNVAEGHLDAIDVRHHESLANKVYAVLAAFEDGRTRPRDQFGVMLGALEKVRRKDLVRAVQELLLDLE